MVCAWVSDLRTRAVDKHPLGRFGLVGFEFLDELGNVRLCEFREELLHGLLAFFWGDLEDLCTVLEGEGFLYGVEAEKEVVSEEFGELCFFVEILFFDGEFVFIGIPEDSLKGDKKLTHAGKCRVTVNEGSGILGNKGSELFHVCDAKVVIVREQFGVHLSCVVAHHGPHVGFAGAEDDVGSVFGCAGHIVLLTAKTLECAHAAVARRQCRQVNLFLLQSPATTRCASRPHSR